MVTAIILAAGSATRLGRCKQLLPFRGKPLIRIVTETVLETQAKQVIVVLGYEAEKVAAVLGDLPVTIAVNREFAQGQSTSLRTGIEAWQLLNAGDKQNSGGLLFVLGDQPLIKSKTIDTLIDSFKQPGDLILPYYQGQKGNPVLLGEEYLPELEALTGDTGAREIIARHQHRVIRVEAADPGVCLDVDTWEDYLRLTNPANHRS